MRITSSGKVGIGTSAPFSRLEVVDTSNAGLRVQTNAIGGTVASFGGNGAFNIDANGQPGGRFTVLENGRVGIGINPPIYRLQVSDQSNLGLRVENSIAGGRVASFGGFGAFNIDLPGGMSGIPGGRFTVLENGNVGIGTNNPAEKLAVSGTGVVRALVNSDSNAGLRLSLSGALRWSLATTTGGNFQLFNDANGQNAMIVSGSTNNVGIGIAPTAAKLFVNSNNGFGLVVTAATSGGSVAEFGSNGDFLIDSSTASGGRVTVQEDGTVLINNPSAGITDPLPRLIVNGTITAGFPSGVFAIGLCHDSIGRIVECVSSIRYKENVHNYMPGLNLIRRLRPVTFDWKKGGVSDMGLIAEEVAEVEPLLATHNANGEIEGVRYDRVAVVLLNAVKEQQAQIQNQQREIDRLKRFACSHQPKSGICKPASPAYSRTRRAHAVNRTR